MNNRYHSRFHAPPAGDALTSGRSSPAFSNLSDIENESTDEFGKRLIQDAKDSQQLRNALRRPNSATQPPRRPGLTSFNLSRQNRLDHGHAPVSGVQGEAYYGSPGSAASGSSVASEPSVRIPREWGRKGRQQPDWLRRRIQTDDADRRNGMEDVSNVFQSRRPRSSTGDTGFKDATDLDWAAAAADVPLPSVEDSPLASRHSTPAAVQNNDSLDRIRDLELSEDFSVASLLASTPAAVTRNSALDEIRIREFQSFKDRSTDSRSERPRPTVSTERRRNDFRSRLTASKSPEKYQSTTHVASSPPKWSASSIREPGSTTITRHRTPVAEDIKAEESPRKILPKSPVVVYTASEARAQSVGRPEDSPRRPDHKREDSHDTLRKLARMTSMSPSPRNTPEGDQETAQPRRRYSEAETTDAHDTRENNSHWLPSEEPSKPAIVSGNASRVSPATPKPGSNDQSPRSRSVVDVKTPQVNSGAWIETPRPDIADHLTLDSSKTTAGRDSRSTLATQLKFSARASPRKPNLPRSALSAVVAHAHGEGSRQDFGDSTIDSLESLITSPTLPSFDTAPANAKSEPDSKDDKATGAISLNAYSDAQARRTGEIEALQSMNERLRLARASIRDARRGVRKIEAKTDGTAGRDDYDDDEWSTDESVSESDSDDAPITRRQGTAKSMGRSKTKSPKRRRSSHHHCHCCREGWFEKNFRKFRRLFWRNGHWTWLGWLCWGVLIWAIVETVLWYVVLG
jgi:hypothetical protein